MATGIHAAVSDSWWVVSVVLVATAVVLALLVRIWSIERSHRRIRALLEKRVTHRTRQLERAYVLTERVVNAVHEAIVVADSNGRAILVNPAARLLLAIGNDADDTGQISRLFDQRHPELHALMRRRLDEASEFEPFTVDVEISGRHRVLEVTGAPLDGPNSGHVFVIRDVTDALTLLDVKSRFVSIVSHEIRTPLTSLAGSLDLLDAGVLGELPERAADLISVACSSTDRLVRLVNDVLDFDRLESDQLKLVQTWLTTDDLLVETIRTMQPLAGRRGVTLLAESSGELVFADHDRLVQVLLNLVQNAIKFAPRGSNVVISADRREAFVVFSVEDEGRGIPSADLQRIFEPFTQIDTADDRQDTGTGLGLAICRGIVNRHGGRIWAENRFPAGSRFVFTVPSNPPEAKT